IVASCCCAVFLFAGRASRGRISWRCVVMFFLVAQIAIYGCFAMGHPSAGTIAARAHRHVFFKGDNGVAVYVTPEEYAMLDGTRRAVLANSKPGDFLVCFPYQPGINLMTNRLTYERDLYVDNANRPKNFNQAAIER